MEQKLKERNGCITAWLYFAIIANAVTGATYLGKLNELGWGATYMTLGAVVNIIGCVLLIQWRKVGFYILTACALVSFFISIILSDINLSSIMGLIAIIVWFGILQIKNTNGQKFWDLLQ